jgi:hypothetical protein
VVLWMCVCRVCMNMSSEYNVIIRLFDSDQLFCDYVTAYLVGIRHATAAMYVPCGQALRALHIATFRHVVH